MADKETHEDTDVAVAEEHDHDHPHHHHDHEEFEFVEDPTFDIDYQGECRYEVKVSIAPANEAKQAEEMYEELARDAQLPGFRRGKAPVKLIERKFKKAVKSEVTGKLVGAAFQKLVKDEDLTPVGYPDIDGLDDEENPRKDGDPLTFTLKFEVAPRVELGKYRGIDVERPVVKIDDKDVEDSIEEMLSRQATYEAVEDTKAEEGDQVVIDFKGTIDGEEFQGGAAENYPYIIGSGRFLPEFEKALKGVTAGKTKKPKVTFPDDYVAEELRGKTAQFTIKVHEVKRKQVPELTEEFAKETGHESIEDMRAKVRERLEESSRSQSSQIAEMRALESVIESSTFEISPRLIEQVTMEQKQKELQQLVQMGTPRKAIEDMMEEIDKRAAEAAVNNVKTLVVLNEIGDAEGVEVTEEDLDKEAAQIGASMGAEAELVAQFIKGPEQRSNYMERIYRAKALAAIMDNANITDKELSREEMEQSEPSGEDKGD